MTSRSTGAILVCALSGAWIASAWFATPTLSDLMFRASSLIVLATSWNLMANAGLISLGHAGFSGIGGYAAVIVAKTYGLPLAVAVPVAIVAGMLLGALLAVATARLSGFFFAIAALAVAEGQKILALMWPGLTGGALGVYIPQQLRFSLHTVSIQAAILAALALAVAFALSQSKFHYACRAMRNGESAAQMLGLDPRRYRLGVLVISGGMAACLGALTSWYSGFLEPRIAYDVNISIMAQIAPIIGGLYTVAGPVIGALVLTIMSELTRGGFGGNDVVGHLLYGVVLLAGVLWMPRGIHGFGLSVVRRLSGARTEANATAPAALSPAAVRQDMPASSRSALLSLRGVAAGYGESVVIEDVSLDVHRGEVVSLLGANGAGKTTTIAAITGLIPCAGSIRFEGQDITSIDASERVARGIALSPEGRKVFPNLTVHENLLLGGFNRHARDKREAKIEEVFALFPRLAERRGQAAGLMSGGEQQMLAIGRALMACPRLLLLDEPSLGLAPKVVHDMFDAIARIARSDVSILLVEQNVQAAFSVAQRGYIMSAGHIVHADDVAALRNLEAVRAAFLGSRTNVATDSAPARSPALGGGYA